MREKGAPEREQVLDARQRRRGREAVEATRRGERGVAGGREREAANEDEVAVWWDWVSGGQW